MIFTTQLELNINIKDINAIYSTEYEQMLLDHAKLMYEGKCRDGQYVKSIDRLFKRSLPNLIKRDLSAKVRVYVVVHATVIRYDQYDIITGMKINKIIPAGKIGNFDMLECRNDHVVALMKIKKDIELFKVGDVIPIRVGQSMYKIGNQHILVNGIPFVPFIPEKICYSINTLTAEDKSYYNDMIIPLIQREQARKEKLDQKRWNQFSDLLYPYKKEIAKKIAISIIDVDAIQKGIFGIDHHINLSNLKIANAEPKPDESITIMSEDPKMALTRIAFPFVKWLENINDLTELYASEEAYQKMSHAWKLYEENKI